MTTSTFLSRSGSFVWYATSRTWYRLNWIAKRRVLAIVLISLLAFAGSSLISVSSGKLPQVRVHDEFGYLLAADTFSKGRLTNPTHPMWVHFESFHILQKPTYMSKFPPGQGLILALGKIVFGHPIFGVWLSVALMCGAICWMLYAWLPGRWAFIGGLIAILNIGIISYWSQGYFGGALTAFAGALFFGAFKRTISKLSLRNSLLMGIAVTILANSRPFEGLVTTLPAMLALMFWFFRKGRVSFKKLFGKLIVPILSMLCLTVLLICHYNKSVTNSWFKFPALVGWKELTSVPYFIWQAPGSELTHRHKVMKEYEDRYLIANYLRKKSDGVFVNGIKGLKKHWRFYLRSDVFVVIILCGIGLMIRNRWIQFAFLNVVVVSFLIPGITTVNPHVHYSAPITCLYFYLLVSGLRILSLFHIRRKPVGKILVLMTLFILVILVFLPDDAVAKSRRKRLAWEGKRPRIVEQLNKTGGQHLIIVRYGKNHSCHQEWVYNEADIDRSTIVWARDINQEQNRKLIKYFRNRSVWLLKIDRDQSPSELMPWNDLSMS